METGLEMPVTGGLFSTNMLIILGVAILFVVLYVIFCVLRENKSNDLKDFSDDDFIE